MTKLNTSSLGMLQEARRTGEDGFRKGIFKTKIHGVSHEGQRRVPILQIDILANLMKPFAR
jgi:hypothetical protein